MSEITMKSEWSIEPSTLNGWNVIALLLGVPLTFLRSGLLIVIGLLAGWFIGATFCVDKAIKNGYSTQWAFFWGFWVCIPACIVYWIRSTK
jgi:hypothetical protein